MFAVVDNMNLILANCVQRHVSKKIDGIDLWRLRQKIIHNAFLKVMGDQSHWKVFLEEHRLM